MGAERQYIDRATIVIERDSETIAAGDANTIEIETSREQEFVHGLTKKRNARGFRSKPIEVTGSMNFNVAVEEEVDLLSILKDSETVQVYLTEEPGGQRRHLENLKFTKHSASYNSEGDVEATTEWMALDNLPL